MHPIAFRGYLHEIREYMALIPGTRAYRKALAALCKDFPDPEDFDPQVKKWDRIVPVCLLASLLGFVSLLILCIVTSHQGRELFTPTQRKLAFAFAALFFIPEIPMICAELRKKHLARAFMEREIRSFGERLNLLSDEQFARIQTLLFNHPRYYYGDEPPMPGDTCGCYECGYIFPADNPKWDWAEGLLSCPRCDSPFLVYGTAEVYVDEETIQLIHNLFFEEK